MVNIRRIMLFIVTELSLLFWKLKITWRNNFIIQCFTLKIQRCYVKNQSQSINQFKRKSAQPKYCSLFYWNILLVFVDNNTLNSNFKLSNYAHFPCILKAILWQKIVFCLHLISNHMNVMFAIEQKKTSFVLYGYGNRKRDLIQNGNP
jgi:hypothetical protein